MDFRTKVEYFASASLPPVTSICLGGIILLLLAPVLQKTWVGNWRKTNFQGRCESFWRTSTIPFLFHTALVEILKGKVYQEEDLFAYKECWHSPMHHGSFSAAYGGRGHPEYKSSFAAGP